VSEEEETLEVVGNLQQPHLSHSIDLYREELAGWMFALFAGTALLEGVLAVTAMLTGHDFSTVRDVARDLILPEASLLGTVMGHYFGVRGR
jgi:hypothetical protein